MRCDIIYHFETDTYFEVWAEDMRIELGEVHNQGHDRGQKVRGVCILQYTLHISHDQLEKRPNEDGTERMMKTHSYSS